MLQTIAIIPTQIVPQSWAQDSMLLQMSFVTQIMPLLLVAELQ